MSSPDTEPEYQVVARTGTARYRTEVATDAHALLADEPAALGGADEGPDPFELLLAALGACTTITLRMYADRKGWPLEEAIARVRRSGDAPDAAASRPRVECELELLGALTDEQRRRLLEIAARCPVHRTLKSGLDIATSLHDRVEPSAENT